MNATLQRCDRGAPRVPRRTPWTNPNLHESNYFPIDRLLDCRLVTARVGVLNLTVEVLALCLVLICILYGIYNETDPCHLCTGIAEQFIAVVADDLVVCCRSPQWHCRAIHCSPKLFAAIGKALGNRLPAMTNAALALPGSSWHWSFSKLRL